MAARVDLHVPSHIQSAVTNGQVLVGEIIELSGAVAVSIQVTCTNGASGSLIVLGSNQLGKGSANVQTATQTVGVNQSLVLTNSLVDDVTGMHVMKCQFTATAAGNVQVSVNVRRTDY